MILGLLLFLASFLILGILSGVFRASQYSVDGDKPKGPYGKVVLIFISSIIISWVTPLSVEKIDAGNVGIKVSNFGGDRGVSKVEFVTGWAFYNPWYSRIKEFAVSQQHIDYEENAIITRGGFQASIKPSFNYSVNAGSVGDMYQNLKKELNEIEQGWLKNAILSSVNDVANLYTVDSIFNHRAEFESDIIRECNKRTARWFTISQLRTNIVPPAAITEAINNKTKAVQEAQNAIQQRIVAEARAGEKIARAKKVIQPSM